MNGDSQETPTTISNLTSSRLEKKKEASGTDAEMKTWLCLSPCLVQKSKIVLPSTLSTPGAQAKHPVAVS
jgi:hypothetical protein